MAMTNAEKKRYLEQYRANNAEIDSLLEELARWRAKAESMSPEYSDMPKAHSGEDTLANAIAKIIELEKEIDVLVDALVDKRRRIEAGINALTSGELRKLLRYKYIQGETLEWIAVKMNYSYRHVCRLHGEALTRLML